MQQTVTDQLNIIYKEKKCVKKKDEIQILDLFSKFWDLAQSDSLASWVIQSDVFLNLLYMF